MAQEETVLIIGIILIILIIAFGIFLYWSYRNRRFFFDYTPPQPPNTFRPAGTPRQLTPAEIQARQNISVTPGPSNPCNAKQNVTIDG